LEVGGSAINFLDLTISEKDGNHEFGIYRKDTVTDVVVHGASFSPVAHKIAAFHSYIHRLTQIPLSQAAFKKEVQIIKYMARVNQVDVNIDRMIQRKMIRKHLDATTTLPRETIRNRKRWIRLPYLGQFSAKLGRVLAPFGFRPAFYNPVTVKSLFVKLKDPIPMDERSGVYRIACGGCKGVYIGETGRQLKLRLSEHKKALSKEKIGVSAFADHLISAGHSYREGSEVLLHREDSYFRRIALEHIEIVRHKNGGLDVLNKFIPDENVIELVYESFHASGMESSSSDGS
jgi:hypothetical protein